MSLVINGSDFNGSKFKGSEISSPNVWVLENERNF